MLGGERYYDSSFPDTGMIDETNSDQSKGRKPVPVCKAILLCDTPIIDAITRKISIIGIIDRFFRNPTGAIAPFHAFAQLVEGIGEYRITLEVHDLSDIQEPRVIARSPEVTINFATRSTRSNVLINVPSLRLDHGGTYDVVMLADGDEIDRQSFTVEDIQTQE